MTIGEGIKKARTEKGWTQAQLAIEAGILSLSVSFYETGRTYPSVLNLISIADALEVSLDELVGRKLH